MRPAHLLLAVTFSIACATTAHAQDDLYSRIKPLETAVQSGTATRAQQLDLARLYIEGQRFYEASKLANAVLAADPNDSDAAAVRAQAVKGLRDIQDRNVAAAESNARKSDATDQDRLALANAYFEAGSYSAAADAYAKVSAGAQDADTRIRHARALAWSSRLDEAERMYSAILRDQSTPELQLEYGRLLSWMGASRPARDTLASVYDSTHTEDAAIALANARAWGGDREGAIQLLEEFSAAHPEATQARQLTEQLRTSADIRLERITKLIDLFPYNLALRVEQARLQYDAGRYAESLKTIAFVRDHTSRNIEGLDDLQKQAEQRRGEELAKLDERMKALDARADSAMASAATPGTPDEALSLAKAYTGLGAYPKAERLYVRYLDTHPDDFEARTAYARVLGWDQRYGLAETQYERLLKQQPDRADLRFEYGQVLSYESDFANALHTFSGLTDISDNPRAHLYSDVPVKAHYNMGQIYRWFGWNEHAALQQDQAIGLDPGYVPARQELDLVRHVRPATGIGATYTYATDSSDFTMKRIDLDAQKWTSERTSVSVAVGRHEFEHLGDSVYANAFTAGLQYRWADRLTGRAHVGANFYDRGLGTRPFFGVGAEWLPNIQSRFALDFNHYDLIYDVFTLTSLGADTTGTNINLSDPIDINDLRGHYDYNTGGHWSWLADASYGLISDDNKREGAHGLLTYRILKAPFVAIKADGRYLSYDFRTNRYWSPTDYKSLAGVLQVGQNIRDRFFWNAEVKYGRAWEGSATSDLRSYEASVTVPITDFLDAVGNYGYGKSGRLDSILGNSGTDFVNYWQRHWYVGVRVKRLFSHGERDSRNPYYYDNSVMSASPVLPPETH